MDTIVKQTHQKFKKREIKVTSIYSRCLISRNIKRDFKLILFGTYKNILKIFSSLFFFSKKEK